MTRRPAHDRTVRLLEGQLEAIASAGERLREPGGRRLERHVRRAEVATRHAVELDLISPEEAGAIWEGVARRHPGARWAKGGPSLAA